MELSPDQKAAEKTVFTSTDQALIDTCSLVLSATSIRHRISRNPSGETSIIVPERFGESAAYQLASFFAENKNWPPPDLTPELPAFPATPPTVLLIGGLAVLFLLTGPWQPGSPWFIAGAGNADAILQGDWFRLVTALTLHADLSHLVGNSLIGGFLVHFFLQIYGPGLGLSALLLAAATGNLLNVLAHGSDHHFVGFSTAVFSVIGMLAMHQIIEKRQPFGIRMMVPFMAGAALLAMLGSSGERTDLGSHLFGLLSGLITGIFLTTGAAKTARGSVFLQVCLSVGVVLMIFFCWASAFSVSQQQLWQ